MAKDLPEQVIHSSSEAVEVTSAAAELQPSRTDGAMMARNEAVAPVEKAKPAAKRKLIARRKLRITRITASLPMPIPLQKRPLH